MNIDDEIFTVALVKGAVEGDATTHFGSLSGFREHLALAELRGLLDQEGHPLPAGEDFYHRHGLDVLPTGRAYLWPDSGPLAAALDELARRPVR